MLLEEAPEHIDLYELCYEIEEVEGVTLIHDVHVWTIYKGNEAFATHVLMDPPHTMRTRRVRLRKLSESCIATASVM